MYNRFYEIVLTTFKEEEEEEGEAAQRRLAANVLHERLWVRLPLGEMYYFHFLILVTVSS